MAQMMEDAATAEISRTQLWHWAFHGASTDKGTKITIGYIDKILDEELEKAKKTGLDARRLDISARYLKDQIRSKQVSDFLTTDLSPYLKESENKAKL
jgi:malate synthase